MSNYAKCGDVLALLQDRALPTQKVILYFKNWNGHQIAHFEVIALDGVALYRFELYFVTILHDDSPERLAELIAGTWN